MSDCHEEIEGKAISEADEQRVRELLDPSTKAGRVCLRMLDQGETIGAACMAEGIDAKAVMAQWHKLTDGAGIRSTEGLRPCISVLASAWKRRWASADHGAWVPVDAGLAASPLANPFFGRYP